MLISTIFLISAFLCHFLMKKAVSAVFLKDLFRTNISSLIGSEEDSRQNCISLIPKPPKQDFKKFMEKDKQGLDSNVLRYMASLDTEKAIDADRRFIVSYFLSDNTLSVYEPLVRNSGIIGGKFIRAWKDIEGA